MHAVRLTLITDIELYSTLCFPPPKARFERETEDLQRKQAWYKANQGSLTREKEAEYITYCNDAMFRIHILEQRLNR